MARGLRPPGRWRSGRVRLVTAEVTRHGRPESDSGSLAGACVGAGHVPRPWLGTSGRGSERNFGLRVLRSMRARHFPAVALTRISHSRNLKLRREGPVLWQWESESRRGRALWGLARVA